MARGKRRRRVAWRAIPLTLAHAFVGLSSTSACGGFRLTDTKNWEGEERCRACEITVGQEW